MREMNKYITALLVVLATTGVEAQNYQSVLKLVLGDVNVEDFYRLKEFKGSEKDILSIIETFRLIKEEKETEPVKKLAALITDSAKVNSAELFSLLHEYKKQQYFLPIPSIRTGIKFVHQARPNKGQYKEVRHRLTSKFTKKEA